MHRSDNAFFRTKLTILIIGLGIIGYVSVDAQAADNYSTRPKLHQGRKWRVGYYEGGPYVNYPANLYALLKGLKELGWLKNEIPAFQPQTSDARSLWQVLAGMSEPYLQFESQSFWSAEWNEHKRTQNRAEAMRQLQGKKLDFMIAMGTWAGLDLANDQHSVATMVMSSSDPVKSGIVKSVQKSGYDHVHARCDPQRYIHQLQLFHDIFRFHRLGVVYENSAVGRSYAALADIEKVAASRRFKIIPCFAPWSCSTSHDCVQNLIDCHETLAPQIDALFITVHRGMDGHQMDALLQPLIAYKIPTWSQRGPQEVQQGVLMSISRGGFSAVGRYHARIMAKILNGAHPGELDQIFVDPKGIAINLKTAAAIEYKPPNGLMKVADEIYK